MRACPGHDQLLELLARRLDGDASTLLATHVEGCAACQRRLEDLTHDRLFADRLPMPATLHTDPALRAVLRRMKERGPAQPVPDEPGRAETPAGSSDWPQVPGYAILGEIGRGGMGVVYKARQARLNRVVALKMIPTGSHAGAELQARLVREAAAVAALHHPAIVQIYEVGEHQGQPYLCLEWIDGGSLAEQLTGSPLPTPRAAALVETLARAIEHAHQRGIIHRDLKPANILWARGAANHADAADPLLLTADAPLPVLKITDFGLAKQLDDTAVQTRSSMILGTPKYMAPEQAGGAAARIGPATDVYALGVILYELITGRVPLQGETPLDTLQLVVSAEPVPPKRLQPNVPRDLETICLKCLEKAPHRRYAGAEMLADELGRFLRGESIKARPVHALERLTRWCRRNPVLGTVSALAASALLAVATLSLLFGIHEARSADALEEALDEKTQQEIRATDAAGRLRTALDDAQAQRQRADERGRQALRASAVLTLDKGLDLCQQPEEAVAGMLWLADSLQLAAQAEDRVLEQVIRTNLASWRAVLPALTAVMEHPGPVLAATFRTDGQLLATAAGNTARLWDGATGAPAGAPLVHADLVHHVVFSPDGRCVLTGSLDGTARLWDVKTAQPQGQTLQHPDRIHAMAFSPDGQRILTAAQSGVRAWDAATGAPMGVLPLPGGPVWAVAFSPDGKTFATGDGTGAQLWDTATNQPVGKKALHPQGVRSVAFHPTRPFLLTNAADGHPRVWDLSTGTEATHIRPHFGLVLDVAFGPGSTVLVANGHAARLYSSAADAIGPRLAHNGLVRVVGYNDASRRCLTGSADRTVRLWQPAPGGPTARRFGPPRARMLVFRPDGKAIAIGTGDRTTGAARVWDLATGQALGPSLPHGGQVQTAAFSPDGKLLVTSGLDHAARLWDAASGRLLARLEHAHIVLGVAFSPDGQTILTGSEDRTAQLWDTTGKPLGPPVRHTSPVRRVAFSPDGRTALSCTLSGAELWNTATRRRVGQPLWHQGMIRAIAFGPKGRSVASGSDDFTARLWDAASSQPIGQSLQHQGPVLALAFSPDGATVLTGSDDGTARLWDAVTSQPIRQPMRHPAPVHCVALSPDGHTILTGCWDGKARLWDAVTGRLLAMPMRHTSVVDTATFTPDGTQVMTRCCSQFHICTVPTPVVGDVERVRLWVQVLTGMELDAAGVVRVLDGATWHARRQRLHEFGGAPVPPT